MNQGPVSGADRQPSDQLTVLVFKDNLTARTFKIPLAWMSRLGTLLGLLCLFTLVSSLFAAKYFILKKKATTAHYQELEHELNLLKNRDNGVLTPAELTASGEQNTEPLAEALTVPSDEDASSNPSSNLFAPLPKLQSDLPDSKSLSFETKGLKIYWQQNTLQVEFSLHYTKTDRGTQQGRIVIVARGPGLLMTYPQNVLSSVSQVSPLISPLHGEVFSVSRFRTVKASFGPSATPPGLTEMEVLIFERNGTKLLSYQRFLVPPPSTTGTQDTHANKTGNETGPEKQDPPQSP